MGCTTGEYTEEVSEKKDFPLTQLTTTTICITELKRGSCDQLVCLYHVPHLRQCIALFAVTEGWLLLDIG